MKKHWVMGVVVAALAVSVLLPPVGHAQRTRITFWHMETPAHRVQTFAQLISDFMKANPGIEVVQETVSWGDAYPRVFSALTAGRQPDMTFTIADFTLAVQQTRAPQVVDDIVAEVDRRYGYVESQLVPFRYEGKYYAVPMWGMTINLYYNEDVVRAGGLTSPPRTWDEMLALCEQLTPKGMYAIAMPTSKTLWGDQVVYSFMVTNRAYIFDKDGKIAFDSPRTVQTLEYLAKLAKCTPPGSATWAWGDGHVAYNTGRVATLPIFGGIRTWEANAPAVARSTRASFIPIPKEGGERGSYSAPNAVMVFTRDAAKREAVKKFLLFLMEPERNGWWLSNMEPGTYVPITNAALKARSFWEHEVIARHKQALEMHMENQKHGRVFGFEFGPNPKIGPIAGANVVAAAAQQVYLGRMTPREAAKWGAEEMQRLVR